jgi:uncharacterized protein YdeI (BOF family)
MRFAVLLIFIVCFAGCSSKGKVLGKTPKDPVSSILAINAGDAPPRITLRGKMFEKCPQAGCWFKLDDGTGAIKVDTKAAGFTVTAIPLNSEISVAGKLVNDGSEPMLEATGVIY